jgi:hypothetical protein
MASQFDVKTFESIVLLQQKRSQFHHYITPLFRQDYLSEKDIIFYPKIRAFPYLRVKWNLRNIIFGLIVSVISNVMIAVTNEIHGATMPTYLLLSSISNIAFNIGIFAWLFDIDLFHIFLTPLFPLYPLLIYIIATHVSPELQLFNYLWHSIHLLYLIYAITNRKFGSWKYIPFATGVWLIYMGIITVLNPQMRFILLPFDQAVIAITLSGMIMTIILKKIQN